MGHLRNAQELTDQHQELTGQPGARGAVPPAALELTGRLAPGRLLGDCWGGPALAFPELFRSGVQPTVEQGRLAARSPNQRNQRSRAVGVELARERDSTTAWLTHRVRPRCWPRACPR